ncbi:glutamine synthetase, partial [Rhizobium ruizarguesonis]
MSPKKTTLKPARNVPASKKTPPEPGSLRGVANWKEAARWLRDRGIEDI